MVKKILATLIVVTALLVPIKSAHAQTRIVNTSPLYCKTNSRFWFILCFQIIGPNGTDKVDQFVGSIHEVNDVDLAGVIQIEGPVDTWAQYAYVHAYQYDPFWINVDRYVFPGTYCAGYLGTWVCQSVHPG